MAAVILSLLMIPGLLGTAGVLLARPALIRGEKVTGGMALFIGFISLAYHFIYLPIFG